LRRAAAVADRAFQKALESLREGVRESDFCAELEYLMQKEGARKPSFDTIVASGPNGAFPHAGVTDRVIRAGELITLDFGVVLDGYNSDITRTVWLGELPPDQEKIYRVVRQAHRAALEVLRAGKKAGEVDAAARQVIADAGWAEAFSHGLGHGLGLAVHEMPRLRPNTETVLEAGMVVTVEPGVYLPGVGGSRVEDSVIVTETGFEYLTRSPYQERGPHPLQGSAPGLIA
ncbi:MAG: M24 family metallopeptidase, partial [Candidatus Eremiobacterota bacterium]